MNEHNNMYCTLRPPHYFDEECITILFYRQKKSKYIIIIICSSYHLAPHTVLLFFQKHFFVGKLAQKWCVRSCCFTYENYYLLCRSNCCTGCLSSLAFQWGSAEGPCWSILIVQVGMTMTGQEIWNPLDKWASKFQFSLKGTQCLMIYGSKVLTTVCNKF